MASISTSHLYNLRERPGYRGMREHWEKTRRSTVSRGERRAPAPDTRPGFIRIDSVHQGDFDGIKGLYLTGQDIISGGVGGALVGGMMTTSAMLGKDAMKVMKLLKDWRPVEAAGSAVPG